MKKNILSIFSLCALMGLSGCNAFLELEPLDKVSPDQLLETEGGVKALLANIYTMIPWKILIIVRMLVLINAVMMV